MASLQLRLLLADRNKQEKPHLNGKTKFESSFEEENAA